MSTFEGSSQVSIVLDDETTVIEVPSGETILNAALDAGLDPPYSCQGGICSSCMALVTKGTAVMEKNSILSDEEVEEGFILTCQAHPTSPKISIDYDEA
jgi:ring-1,2-phenylacetyl-CoA epoxidase subunit PaaE